MIWNAVFGGLALTTLAAQASACSVCIGLPAKTTADYLVEGHCIVLARHDEENRFQYAPVEVLRGTVDGAIDLFVDSVSRRILQANSGRHVLLVQAQSRGDWRSLGVLTPEFELIVRRIIMFSPAWNGKGSLEDRRQFFLPLFGHQQRAIRELAYLELSRAPYAFVKQLGHLASRNDYASMLTDAKYVEWRSLAILLLAQSSDPMDKQHVLDSFHSAHRFHQTMNLSAWATAAIELDGAAALDYIDDNYFRSSQRMPEERQAIVKALSLHGDEGESVLRDRIVQSYAVLLHHAPELAPRIADDLHAWKSTELTDRLSRILNDDASFSLSDRESIRRYLLLAASPKETSLVHD